MYQNHDGSGMDKIMLGQVSQRAEATDRFFSKIVTRCLHTEDPPFGRGHDLPATNIQRGRDHGIPGKVSINAWVIFYFWI